MSGDKALLVVDGAPPKFVATGQTHAGVKVLHVAGGEAKVEMKGQTLLLKLGETPANVTTTPSAQAAGNGNKVVLTADGRGHFMSLGSINGQTVNFMVDTGATMVALGQADAQRIGLKAQQGNRVRMSTANGVVEAVEHRLDKVRLGDTEVRNVTAVVMPLSMPYVLLGNSFLTRFQMLRVNDQLTLERKP
ncbi:MAG: retroviral-like aspartic protease family protein [Burkholderiales bacterium]|nr:retroviral-like aspartic protease family protein [Burkholderiales bacterium]